MPKMANAVDRVLTFRNSQGVRSQATLLHMSRAQIVFEVYNPYSIVQVSEVLTEVNIKRAGGLIYDGKAVVQTLVNTGLFLVVSATIVDRWADVINLLARSNDVRSEVDQFVRDWEISSHVRPGYQLAVGELRSFLSQLNPWLDQVDIANEDDAEKVPQDVYEQLREGLMPRVAAIQQHFEHEAKLVPTDEREAHCQYAQRDLLPLMMRAPFFFRSRTKPLGYAGDYMMVKMMVEGRREGVTTYARLVNDFYLEIDLVRGHRNRLIILEERLTRLAQAAAMNGSRISILNIGCGPAIELVRFIENCPESVRCQFRLMDFNGETIAYARDAIETAKRKSGRNVSVEFVEKSVNDLLRAAANTRRAEIKEYDLVYCAGLFDYFQERVCARLLELFCDWTKIGGSVIATNVTPVNPTRYIMEHVVDWYLVHRTPSEMTSLAPPGHPYKVFDDATHTNVILDITVAE